MDERSRRFFVCGKDHRANNRHSREEVTTAVNKLKEKHPNAFVTVEDLSAVVNMVLNDSENDEASEHYAQWANDDGDAQDSDISFLTMDNAAKIEKSLENRAFAHGRSIPTTTSSALAAMYWRLQSEKRALFDGVLLDTATNR